METVELGDVRLHVLTTWPGAPGESDRVAREVARLDPAVLLADLDTEDALRLQKAHGDGAKPYEPGFVDDLFQREIARRYAKGDSPSEHPFVGAARVARTRKATFLPLRPTPHKKIGFFARRRARKAAEAIPPGPIEHFGRQFALAMTKAEVWEPAADVAASEPRVTRALDEGRGPLVALVQAHRAAPLVERLRENRRGHP